MSAEGQDPKSALNQFCQSYCKKPVTKTDIIYTSAKYGNQYQVTVKLNCIGGQEFAGEVSDNPKLAEKLAAAQALNHFKDVIDTMPQTTKKRKPDTGAAAANKVAKMAPPMMPGSMALAIPGAPGPANPAASGAYSPKMVLNSVCMKLAKRALTKGEMIFEVAQTPMGYQCTCQLPCLPGELGQSVWAGEVAANKKTAEQNAAKIALEAISPGSLAALEAGVVNPVAALGGGGGGGWKGGNDMWKGMGKGWDMWMGMGKGYGKGKAKGPSGDNLPRERITQVPVTGDVLEWKGKYGWVKLHAPIEHQMAGKRGGKIFLSGKDFTGSDPAVGSTVQFQVYADESGLGAEEAFPF